MYLVRLSSEERHSGVCQQPRAQLLREVLERRKHREIHAVQIPEDGQEQVCDSPTVRRHKPFCAVLSCTMTYFYSSSSPDSTPACSDSEECDSAAMTSSTSLADPSKLRFRRPWHFKPFSHGKRACMGYKMVENVCQVMTVAMIKEFELATPEGSPKLPVGLLGLPIEPVYLAIKKRKIA